MLVFVLKVGDFALFEVVLSAQLPCLEIWESGALAENKSTRKYEDGG